MRISRKIGLSFFVTFLLVIVLGIVSIYSMRHIYKGLSQVFAKDLPASRAVYEIAISSEGLLSELNNFLITGNENFQVGFNRSYKILQEDILALKKFISTEEETGMLDEIKSLVRDINATTEGIFTAKKKIKSISKDIRKIEVNYKKIIDELFRFEEEKMLGEKDLLLIQAQYIPASQLIMDIGSRFSRLFDGLLNYIISMKDPGQVSLMEDLLVLQKNIRDYKNYYGYSLSDKERSMAAQLIELSDEAKLALDSVVKLKKDITGYIDSIFAKEKIFTEIIDKLLALKKTGISSKLGIGAVLTEDIPAIHNISKIEKDLAESWRLSGRYILTGDENYKNKYYQLRQNIDKELKDYGRHARLKGTEKYLEDIVESDEHILETVNSNISAFDKKEADITELLSIKDELEKKIDELLEYNESTVRKSQDIQAVLKSSIPARWVLARIKDEFSSASRIVANYLNEQDSQYKDIYSEAYFNLKKRVNRYGNLVGPGKELAIIKQIEMDLDKFNTLLLAVIDAQDKIVMERGWTIVKLEEDLKGQLDKAVTKEISQIEENKKYLKNRIAVINTTIFVIIGVVALIAVFIIFYTTNSITNPIQKLYEGAEIIGKGNLDHRFEIKTGDEIQDLAEGFNKMAGELKGLYTNLENKVKERTAQLAEANSALGLKNKELDDFTYIVSHDLKEPLRGVKAFTKLLIEEYSGKLDDEGREHLKTISESSSCMTSLIEDLLNLSRIGRIRNIEPDVDLNEILSGVKKNLQYSLEEKKVDLKVAEDFPKVMCDRIRISEVFSNLVSNAIKYSKKDVRPVIELGYCDKGGLYEFYVKDNGIGIEKQYHDRVFQIFQRLHAKGEYEGTGAGLTIVKKIVENHGGKIWLDSEIGKGTTFYFTIPKNHSSADNSKGA
ncbi:MAG: HAMP domain-containing protein [Candidatus Omnitrophica bacterium]|nr:HAMP domain-containing protein [Candidatus Omnitrophota bacterium]MBU4148862.1 HAMP domain-containing protein [Candidatus Omnitrophota bacterium]